MRVWIIVYSRDTETYRLAYHDSWDTISEYYIDEDVPPFKNKEAAHRVANAFNTAGQ